MAVKFERLQIQNILRKMYLNGSTYDAETDIDTNGDITLSGL